MTFKVKKSIFHDFERAFLEANKTIFFGRWESLISNYNFIWSDQYDDWLEILGQASWNSSDPSSLKNSNPGKVSYKKFMRYFVFLCEQFQPSLL